MNDIRDVLFTIYCGGEWRYDGQNPKEMDRQRSRAARPKRQNSKKRMPR